MAIKPNPIYINGKPQGGDMETIDELETHREARRCLREYETAFGSDWKLWLSQRCTNEWRN